MSSMQIFDELVRENFVRIVPPLSVAAYVDKQTHEQRGQNVEVTASIVAYRGIGPDPLYVNYNAERLHNSQAYENLRNYYMTDFGNVWIDAYWADFDRNYTKKFEIVTDKDRLWADYFAERPHIDHFDLYCKFGRDLTPINKDAETLLQIL